MSPSKRTAVIAVLLAAAGLTAACADEATSPGETAAAPSSAAQKPKGADKAAEAKAVAEIVNKYHRYVDANQGKKACALMTKDFQWVFAQNAGGGCAAGVDWQHDQLGGTKLAKITIHPDDVVLRKNGKEALLEGTRIAKRNGTKGAQANYELVKRGKAWKLDYIS